MTASLALALVLLSPGFEATRAFAAIIESAPAARTPNGVGNGQIGRVVLSGQGAVGLGSSASRNSVSFSAPVADLGRAPVFAPLPVDAAASRALPVHGAAPALPVVAAAADAPKADAASGAVSAPAPVVDAAKASAEDAPAPIHSAVAYRAHRLLLNMVAALTGEVHSLRPADEALTARAVRAAADRRAVFADFDETLADSNAAFDHTVGPEMVAAIREMRAVGKTVDVISDRPESVLKSLVTLPVETRAGMFVAVDQGGRVYRYDAAGEPVLVHSEPAMSAEIKAVVEKAAAAAKTRLGSVHAELLTPSAADADGAEVWRPYTYTMRFKVGTEWDSVRAAGEILQDELAKAGSDLVVKARRAKSDKNPSYVVVSVNSKAKAAAYIASVRGLSAKDVVLVGDGMYAPGKAGKSAWLNRFGARISGRSFPDQGNANDAEMETALRGAKTFSVGVTGDPRRSNLTVLAGKGPQATLLVLRALASELTSGVREYGILRVALHRAALWFHSAAHYFIDINVENWREYREARAQSPAVLSGESPIVSPRRFFADARMMGMLGGPSIVGSRNGSDLYMKERARAVFDRYFVKADSVARAAFFDFVDRAAAFNPNRSASNLRKQIRKALQGASLLPASEMAAHFDRLMREDTSAAAEKFQREDQARVLDAFHQAVRETVAEEAVSAPNRVVGVVLLGSFATGSTTPTSDFDLHVLTTDGASGRIKPFLDRLEKRWNLNPDSKGHPLNGAEFGFLPSRSLLLKIHNDKYLIFSDNERLERALSPPADFFHPRPNQPSFFQHLQWLGANRLLRGAMKSDDFKAAAAGAPVTFLDAATRRRATIGWITARTLYLAGFVLSGAIAYPILARLLVGAQGYTDLMSLGAVVGILLAPFSGKIFDAFSFRNTFALNNAVRLILALAIPALVYTATGGFLPLLLLSLVSSWNVASSLIAEDKLLPLLAGSDTKKLAAYNAAANINFIGLSVLLGTFLSAGSWVDKAVAALGPLHGLAAIFLVNAALCAVAMAIQWWTIPNVRVVAASAPQAPAAPQAKSGFLRWSALLAVGGGLFALLHPIAPQFATLPLVGAVLAGLITSGKGLSDLWKSPVLRTGAMLSMIYAFVVYPIQGILIPFAARELAGGALLQGQLQGAMFFGQLLAASTLLKLPGKWNAVVRAGVLSALGAWIGFYLFPASLAMAAVGMGVGFGLYALSTRLTDRGWMKHAVIGLAALALPLAFWGNIPLFLLSMLVIGMVTSPSKIVIDTIVQTEAKADPANTGRILGLKSALTSIAAAFGYASFGALSSAAAPAFPTALWPMVVMLLGVGALLWLAPRWMGSRLSKSSYASAEPAAPAAPREYSGDELAEALAARVAGKGVKVIVTDYDGTLMNKTADNKAVPSSEKLGALIAALRKRGVTVVVSTNHFFTGDHNGMTHLLGDRLDPAARAGMFFVVQSGARVYEYGADGATPAEPIWKQTVFNDAERAELSPVFEAAARNAGLKPGEWEMFHEESRSLIEVRGPVELQQERAEAMLKEIAKNNKWGYLVQIKDRPTMRKDEVPYVQYFKANKGTGTRRIFDILKERGLVEDEAQVLILGDDYEAGGNDLFMAQALPGALAVSVGKKWDATQPNVMQSAVRGADATQDLLGRLDAILAAKSAAK